jgi:AcrR family transcriptional regulator
MNKRSIQKERTRSEIIKAAVHLFSCYGFLNVNTASIAEDAHVSHGALFSHFSHRDDLILAVIEQFGMEMVRHIHDSLDAHRSIEKVLNAHLICIRKNEMLYTHLIREYSLLPSQVRTTLTAIQSAVSHHLSIAANTEIANKHIKKIAPDLLFNTWLGLIQHYLINRELFLNDLSDSIIQIYGKRLLEHFLHIIKVSSTKE